MFLLHFFLFDEPNLAANGSENFPERSSCSNLQRLFFSCFFCERVFISRVFCLANLKRLTLNEEQTDKVSRLKNATGAIVEK